MKKISKVLLLVIMLLSFLIIFSTLWIKDTFGLIDMDKLLYHLFLPLKGTEKGMINSYIYGPLLLTIVTSTIIFLLFNWNYKYDFYINITIGKFKIKLNNIISHIKKLRFVLLFMLFIYSLFMFSNSLNLFQYIKNSFTNSTFIEDNYVDPKEVNIVFPDKKKNLIYIFAESLEYTYTSIDNGGAYKENLIPHLTDYAKKYISFTNDNHGGFYTSNSTGWTIAGMVAQTSGVGLKVGTGNDMGSYSKFLPGSYSMGEILEKEGYNQVLLIGSDAAFAGRNDYFKNHGNYTIKDYVYAKENGLIDKDYYVWWGYEDSKLFSFAKDELINLSKENKPFNLTLLTTNTHHIGGYLESDCEIKFDEKYKNAIYCSDKQIYEFIEWVKKQDFYKDTVIVINGDHLSMDSKFFDNIGQYNRTNFNLIINSSIDTDNKSNRLFYAMDLYPTVLASMGAQIDGDRLALGTNLFSKEKTLYEKYGITYVEGEYSKKSNFYRNKIVFGL